MFTGQWLSIAMISFSYKILRKRFNQRTKSLNSGILAHVHILVRFPLYAGCEWCREATALALIAHYDGQNVRNF